jgi:hypothetical protein
MGEEKKVTHSNAQPESFSLMQKQTNSSTSIKQGMKLLFKESELKSSRAKSAKRMIDWTF